MRPMTTRIETVAFDLGGVLIDWNPRHLYRLILDDEAEIERFLAEVCTPSGTPPSMPGTRSRTAWLSWRESIRSTRS